MRIAVTIDTVPRGTLGAPQTLKGNRLDLPPRRKVPNPPIFVRVTLSFAIALLGITAIGLILWALSGSDVSDILQNLPKPLSILFGLCGAYAAIGGLFLYVLMWIYLIAFDRTSPLARVGWVFALIFTLQYGALLYYFVVLTRIKPVSENLALAE
jgi:hypothetical protein